MDNLKSRAALYVRVSTLEQAQEGYSVSVQKEKLTQYANAQSYEIADIYSDEGFSGKDLFRPAMERLLNDVKAGKINIVLIYKLDRLSRHVKDVLELVELFDKFNVTLYSLNENLDLSSPFGRAALKMSATFSELERETIVERMEMGKRARAKSGKYTCPGKSPFGYRQNKETDRMEIVPEEAEAIRDMYAKYIEGFTFRKLYAYCKEKYPNIRFFSNSMCCKPVIERPMYAGYFYHNGELIKATNYEPIISYETYLQAQEVVKRNTTKREHDNTPYLLTGLIYCGRCGRTFCGKRRTHKDKNGKVLYSYTSYGCTARVKYARAEHGATPCSNEIYPTEELEQIVEQHVMNLQFTEFVSPQATTGLIDKLLLENGELKKQKERLLDLYLADSIDKDVYTEKYDAINKQIQKNLAVIESEQETLAASPTVSIEYLKQKQQEYPTASKQDKRRFLQQVIKQIVIDGDKVTINWLVK